VLRKLLICGLVAGLVGGLLAFAFMRVVGEPPVDAAIAYEEANAPPVAPGEEEEELVTRDTQKSVGLLTASTVYGLALGGIFALVFAYVYGRVSRGSPGRTALWLAAIAFVVVYLVPFVKYPPNPPAVGDTETIGERTALYLVMIWISVLAAIAAARLRHSIGIPLAVGGYLLIVVIAGLALPTHNDIPADFPATTLYEFRLASVGTQLIMWASIGLVFAAAAQRVMTGRPILASVTGKGVAVSSGG
jgi:predicted cobalt transporter CbtA